MSAITITVTNDFQNCLRDSLKGANNPQITYVALGTGSTAPSVNDHTLANEVFRKKVTSYTNGGAVGELLVVGFFGPSDAIGVNIQEVGLFAGNSASGTANTGVLVGRGLVSHVKGTSESDTVQLDIIV